MNAVNPDANDIKVSVCMITYNHERFIAQAIESVLMQETDFRVELVIGEDCSTDGTRAIVREFGERFPERIRLLLPEHNLGMMPNFVATLSACRGQYVALLEGDDYWTDPHKLQKQVEFLEAHPECSMCFHDVMVVYEDHQHEPHRYCSPDQKRFSTLEDLLERNFIPTCSVVYRRGLVDELPPWYFEMPMGDWPLHVLHAQHGTIGYVNEVMSVYRKHPGGVYSQSDKLTWLDGVFDMYAALNAHFAGQYHEKIIAGLSRVCEYFFTETARKQSQPMAPDQVNHLLINLFSRQPDKLTIPFLTQQQIKAKCTIAVGFTYFQSSNLHEARRFMLNAIFHDTRWLRNRGVLKILLGLRKPDSYVITSPTA